MTKDEALKLAMEAMEITGGFDVEINAIKESLADTSPNFNCKSVQARLATAWGYVKAQPEKEPVTLSEGKKLILVDSSFDDLIYWLERCESKGHLENCSDLIEPWEKFCDSYCVWTDHHPDCKLAQPEQERFLVATIGNWGRVEWADGVFPSIGDKMYSAQPKWVGLTDEDIKPFCDANHIIFGAYTIDFVRAIEAKLKEKNT